MAVGITQTANPAGVNHSGNITTYSTVSIGSAAPDKQVLVAIGKEVASVVVNSVTITDDVGTRLMDPINGTTFASMGAWLYIAHVSCTATTATIAITWSGAITSTQNHISVYTVTDAEGPSHASGTNTSTDMDATAPLTSGSVPIATNGGMFAVSVGATDTVARTWVRLTKDLDVDAGGFRYSTASNVTAGAAATRTCNSSTNGEDGVMAWANFVPAAKQFQFVAPPMIPVFRKL